MNSPITSIAFVVYPVSDMRRARDFYEGVLGLPETGNYKDVWVEYDVGGSTLAVSNLMESLAPGVRGVAAALEVTDFDPLVARLREAETEFLAEPFDTGVCRMAIFADPDGNPIVLHHKHG